jgi:phosphoglucosamine mutase
MEAGFNAAGVDVLLLGPIPTPAVAYLTRAQRAQLGVVISASHNPFEDNGIKFFSAHGAKLPDAWEQAVEDTLEQTPAWVSAAELGKTRRLNDAAGRYIEFCKSTFGADNDLRGLKLVVDAAHGAAYQIAPKVFTELGATVVTIGCDPDGLNINRGVGATHPEALVAAVREHGADVGIALDGDADRLQMVDASGRLLNGDELLYVMAMDRVRQGETVPGVVGTLMTNLAVELALRDRGIAMARAKVGDRYVLEVLAQRGWNLGGEGSGHLLALDQHSTGDGLVSALQVLRAVVDQGRTLTELLEGVTLFPQTLINVRLASREVDWSSNTQLRDTQAAVEAELGDSGRVLIRASGTEPLVRVMVEARDAAQAQSCAQRLAQCLQ